MEQSIKNNKSDRFDFLGNYEYFFEDFVEFFNGILFLSTTNLNEKLLIFHDN